MTGKIKVSVVIKALNEEEKIASTIESALKAISKVTGEVILADSHSTDKTTEIAARYPIKIISLTNPADRSCGVGGQLGYQAAIGEYIWIVDGDMELSASFILQAITCLESDQRLAGVSGIVVEKNLESLEFRARVMRAQSNLAPGFVDRLDGGGVYRRSAIESIGYFTNKNLHSYEEYELAARLRTQGWLLLRIATESVSHFGHKAEAYALLRKRWSSGYIRGIGELLRSAIGKPHLRLILLEVRELRLYGAVVLWWITLIFLLSSSAVGVPHANVAATFFALLPVITMIIKKRSITTAVYSVVAWHYYASGLLLGFSKPQKPPETRVAGSLVHGVQDLKN
jgi:glycosyltransferase involved in cell wall biosynthesis